MGWRCKTPSLQSQIYSEQLGNVPTDLHRIDPDEVDGKEEQPNEKARKNNSH